MQRKTKETQKTVGATFKMLFQGVRLISKVFPVDQVQTVGGPFSFSSLQLFFFFKKSLVQVKTFYFKKKFRDESHIPLAFLTCAQRKKGGSVGYKSAASSGENRWENCRLPLKKPLHLLWMTSLAFTWQFMLLHCAPPLRLEDFKGLVLGGKISLQ